MIAIRRVPPARVREAHLRLLTYGWEPDGRYWGAFDGSIMAGFAGCVPSRRWLDCVYFHSAGVEQAYRGQRLQRRLIRVRLRWARANGYAWAITYTVPDNVPSARNLVACGFRPWTPPVAWAEGTACYWSRRL